MRLARVAKRSPKVLAEEIAAAIPPNDVIERIEIANPGFLNVTLRDRVARRAQRRARGERPARRCRSPRIRTASSSTTRTRTSRRRCTSVTSAAPSSATRSRACSSSRAHRHPPEPHRRLGHAVRHADRAPARPRRGTRPTSELGIGELDAFYQGGARRSSTSDRVFADRSRKRVVALQARRRADAAAVASARRPVERATSRSSTRSSASLLKHDDIAGESFYNRSPRAARRRARSARLRPGSATARSAYSRPASPNREGAAARRSSFGRATAASVTRRPISPRSATGSTSSRRRGSSMSSARRRPSTSRWCSTAARELGWLAPPARVEHVAFGSVLGTDKQMFKTRAGDTVRLVDLIDEAIDAPRRRAIKAEKNRRPRRRDARRRSRGCRHRRDQVRRSLERSGQGLRLRSRSHGLVRWQHRRVLPVRARAHPLDASQGAA